MEILLNVSIKVQLSLEAKFGILSTDLVTCAQNPCGSNTVCTNTSFGRYACNCLPGFIFGPDAINCQGKLKWLSEYYSTNYVGVYMYVHLAINKTTKIKIIQISMSVIQHVHPVIHRLLALTLLEVWNAHVFQGIMAMVSNA